MASLRVHVTRGFGLNDEMKRRMEACPSRLRPCLIAGEVLLGRYRVVGQIGEGGFGRVYQADDLTLRRQVALKVARREEHEGRLEREARLAARLTSPHSVRIFDVQRLEDDSTLIVMELLSGVSLREYLSMRGRVDVPSALAWALELAEALFEAHSIGLVHRDLKPSNLFVVDTNTGRARIALLDFGLARVPEGNEEHSMTGSDAVLGSPAYMSPEQIRSGRVSHQSDIWSFGVVLHEMLAGTRPFRADSNLGLIASISTDPPESLAEVRPGLSSELYELVSRCLNRAPENRLRDIGEAMKILRSLVSPEPGSDSQVIAFTVNREQSPSETTLVLRESEPQIRPSGIPSLDNELRAQTLNQIASGAPALGHGATRALLAAATTLGLGAFVWFGVQAQATPPHHSLDAERKQVQAPASAAAPSVSHLAERAAARPAQSDAQHPAQQAQPSSGPDSHVERNTAIAPAPSRVSSSTRSRRDAASPSVKKAEPERSENSEAKPFFAEPDF